MILKGLMIMSKIQILSLELDYEKKAILPFVKTIENSLKEMQNIIKCQRVTCTEIEIEGKKMDCWSDDEALFSPRLVPTLYINDDLIIFGNILFAGHDDEGATTSLSDEDIGLIMRYIRQQNPKLRQWINKNKNN